jgi:hypothetical protein
MKALPVVLGMVLTVSLMFNVVAFVRLNEEPAPAVPARGPAATQPRPAEQPVDAPAAAAKAVEAPAPAAPAAAGTPKAAPTIATSSIRNDPKVREVLQANEAYNSFWRDLDRVAKVRSKFDEPKYAQTVLTASTDFLELGDPKRGQFEEAAQAAAASYAAARKEQDAAKKALPPKDKSNATAYAVYQQQKDEIDLRFNNQVQAAVATLKPYLSAENARHQEFLQNAGKWLRTLAPRPTQP